MNTVDSLHDKQHNGGELLFFILFIPWVALVMLTQSTLYYKYIADYHMIWRIPLHLIPILVVCVKILLFDKTSLMKKALMILALLLAMFQFFSITFDDDLFLPVILVLASCDIDLKKILKVYLWESVAITATTTIMSLIGFIPNITSHQYSRTRYSLGAIWCTDYAAKFFFMLLICLYLYSKKMKWFHWIGLLALSTVVFYFTFGKLDFICMILSLLVFFFHEQIEKKDAASKLKSIWEKFLEKFAPFFTPIAAAIMAILTVAYSSSNAFLSKLDHALTGRLDLGHRAISEIGITLFGQRVTWIGMGNSATGRAPEGYNFVDCSYLNILFTFGVITCLIVLAAHSYMAYRNRKDLRFVLVIAFISLNCIVAHHFTELAYNPFWAGILAMTSASVASPEKEPKQTVSEQSGKESA